ncbi:Beta-glucosidase-like glycosyl hydrolase [Flavobacterium anhuiense]|uniref:Beta-glucosidase-like glycosyl hydrolase n=1 Tax=Flavobacterium anhuiense TaxID=459526 RepID=A0A444VSJ3_9FLAO|nr:glycoside hydrolase family 3 C-terminal domain-containing protein [Flavobacterium anhuiense]RYJ36581.1 Beta-glucosidase-like glycosyl hydrolase [Flavobacterium anhuiense]
MKKRYITVLLLLYFFLSPFFGWAQKALYLDQSQPIEVRVKDALSRMTVEEKVALCHAQSKFSSKGVPRLGIPDVWSSDGSHGVSDEKLWDEWNSAQWTSDSCTAFPALTCLAATFNPKIAQLYGTSIGEEARYRNKTMLLGPGVNIYRTPLNGRNFEYMGEDPFLASRMVVPYVQGVQSNGVAACVKHFALNNQEIARGEINVNVSDRALHEIYFPAFKAAVQEGNVWSIMGAYNKIWGVHCCHNDILLNQILKIDWKFDGVVVSDWGGVHNTDEAVNGGLDIEMGTYTNGLTTQGHFPFSSYYLADPLLKGIKSGQYEMSKLDDKASRILRMIFRTTMSAKRPYGRFVSPEHSDAARKIAQEGIVLLKNEKQFLPIPQGRYKKIAVIGENAVKSLIVGGGSTSLKAAYEISPLQGLKNKYGENNIVYSMGYASGRPLYGAEEPSKLNLDSLQNAAIETARHADIVLFVGGLNKNYFQDCESGDRKSLSLPFGQDKLIEEIQKVNHNVAVVLLSGNAVLMPWLNKAKAVVQGWYLGSEAGNALADIISGEANPSGKLPISFPKKLEDVGAHSFDQLCYPGDGNNVYHKEDILVGYRWYDTKKIPVLFPFGYGLSYTTFQYGKPAVSSKTITTADSLEVTVSIKNTGKVAGKEVVQLYVNDETSSLPRPTKELKGFEKISLEPGEEKTVRFTLTKKDLSYYDDTKKEWIAEPGKFRIMIGASATDIRGVADFNLK